MIKTALLLLAPIFVQLCFAQKDVQINNCVPQPTDGAKIYLLPNYAARYYKQQEIKSKTIKKQPIKNLAAHFNTVIKVRKGASYTLAIGGIRGAKTICLAEGDLSINITGRDLKAVTFSINETAAADEHCYQSANLTALQ